MPVYEYRCQQCGHEFENLARTMNAKAPACPKCGGAAGRKLSTFGVAVKAEAPAKCQSCSGAGSCPMAQR
ncbi:MAG: zinc ribbon domain-containing protein [Planctomycetes bacterium]|nr:zinc ribbon domain-containing protein [Planctomycetota bacterium]